VFTRTAEEAEPADKEAILALINAIFALLLPVYVFREPVAVSIDKNLAFAEEVYAKMLPLKAFNALIATLLDAVYEFNEFI